MPWSSLQCNDVKRELLLDYKIRRVRAKKPFQQEVLRVGQITASWRVSCKDLRLQRAISLKAIIYAMLGLSERR